MSGVTAVVLAGGSSRRMGRDKALLTRGEATWLEHVVGVARAVASQVLVVGRPPPADWRFDEVACLADEDPGQGPLGGLVTGLRRAEGDVLALACDMPLLGETALRWLLAEAGRAPDARAVVARLAGGTAVEPLFAIYRSAALPEAEARLAGGERALHRLLTALDAVVVEPPAAVARQLLNVNDPDDLAALQGPPPPLPPSIEQRGGGDAESSIEQRGGAAPTLAKHGFARELCAWYRDDHRELPWRQTRDPYRVWVSEIMLQQTQVATVLPYYERFLEAFPAVAALAGASEDAVLKLWEGLGYYARARNLLAAARQIVAEHGGRFPTTLDAVCALPGVGRSTAGSILTFAMGQRHAILDGNVKRVLARVFDCAEDITRARTQHVLWEWSEALLAQAERADDFNQALMELGATVCTPRQPACERCPVRRHCEAFENQTQAERPVKKRRAPVPHHHIAVGVIWDERERLLVQQRPSEGLLGGLWEFPGGKREAGEALADTVAREVLEELGLEVEVGDEFATVQHAYSHFRITLHAFDCRYRGGEPEPRASQQVRWVGLGELDALAFPKANKTVLELLKGR